MYELFNKETPSIIYFILNNKGFLTVLISCKKIYFLMHMITLGIRRTALYAQYIHT